MDMLSYVGKALLLVAPTEVRDAPNKRSTYARIKSGGKTLAYVNKPYTADAILKEDVLFIQEKGKLYKVYVSKG